MASLITLFPISPGMTAEWRAFVSELHGPRRAEWAQSQRNRGIRREVISFASGRQDFAVVYSESADHDLAARRLRESSDPFDQWYRERVAALLDTPLHTEMVFDSAPKPGPWRGMRLWRGTR